MAAITAAEIRQQLEMRLPARFDPPEGLYDALAPIFDSDMALVRAGWSDDFTPPDDHPGTLWADMRASEVDELYRACEDVLRNAMEAYVSAIREGLTEAVVRFSEAHPDIPAGTARAERELVPA